MRTISEIEHDCFYLWIDKPQIEGENLSVKKLFVGKSIAKILNETGAVKFKKFFERNIKKEKSVAYRYEQRFKKDLDSKWFIISKKPLTKSKVTGSKEFKEITVLKSDMFVTTNRRKILKSKHYLYVVTF